MCILEAQVLPHVSPQVSPQVATKVATKVAILKTQPAQTTSKINISSYLWRMVIIISIQLYLSTARTKLARKRRNLRSCGRESFLYLESCAGFNAQIDETSLRVHIFAINKTKYLFCKCLFFSCNSDIRSALSVFRFKICCKSNVVCVPLLL
jgi:hypothetical protein